MENEIGPKRTFFDLNPRTVIFLLEDLISTVFFYQPHTTVYRQQRKWLNSVHVY